MDSVIRSLHHVTATVSDAQEDVDFYTRTLGMRLVKQTVNFDNHDVYHFYYGNERGAPGTIMTTFPYKNMGVPVGTKGAGQITVTSFSVPAGSLGFWERRLRSAGVTTAPIEERFGEETLSFPDPSGLTIELIAAHRDDRVPWIAEGIDDGAAVRGIHGVTMIVRSPDETLELLRDVLGYEVVGELESRTRLAVNGDRPGHTIEVVAAPDATQAVNGLGTVHHVAMAVSSDDEQLRMRKELQGLGYRVTQVMDRQYFRSIYFREPGGILFEIATVPPGFTIDEEVAHLGRELKLPPWEEPHRAAIEAGLPTIERGGEA